MNKLLCFIAGISLIASSIYDYSINDIDGNNISLDQYKGKKILFVNTASSSVYTSQYAALEQLYQKYKDSLVIICIPSNSFGNETGDNAQIKDYVSNTYNTHFILAGKSEVTGESQIPLYAWLTHGDQNGMMTNSIQDDFYKFLVDDSGQLIGAFVSSVDPMSDAVQEAITNQ